MVYLRVDAIEHKYQEKDRRLKEHMINDINDQVMMAKIINGLSSTWQTNEITSEQVLS